MASMAFQRMKGQDKGDVESVLQIDRWIHCKPLMSVYNIDVFMVLIVKIDYV